MANYPSIHDYASALRFIEGGRSRTSRTFPGVRATSARVSWPGKDEGAHQVIDPVTNADNTCIIIRQHNTDIITYYQDGTVRLNSGGWRTLTTKDRLNQLTRACISQEKGIWYVATKLGPTYPPLTQQDWRASRVLFEDGMLVDAQGVPLHQPLPQAIDRMEARKAKLDKAITRYIRDYVQYCTTTSSFPYPGPGDCLYCHLAAQQSVGQAQMVQTGNGKLVGGKLVVEDTTGKPELFPIAHLLSHIGLDPESPGETYIPLPSLAWLAFVERGHGDPAFVWALQKSDFEQGRAQSWSKTWLAMNLRAYFRTRTTKLLTQMEQWETAEQEQQQAENKEA